MVLSADPALLQKKNNHRKMNDGGECRGDGVIVLAKDCNAYVDCEAQEGKDTNGEHPLETEYRTCCCAIS